MVSQMLYISDRQLVSLIITFSCKQILFFIFCEYLKYVNAMASITAELSFQSIKKSKPKVV